jgi:Na+/phosphate symporter
MSIKRKMFSGFAIAIMLILGLWVVGSFYALLKALMSSPIDTTTAAINILFFAIGCIILGWYVTSRWYKGRT